MLQRIEDLDAYAADPFVDWPHPWRTFYAGVDDLHGALVHLVSSAMESLDVAMYGFDDPELAQIIADKMANPAIRVRLTLDRSQAGGVHERALLDASRYPNNHVAIGSSRHGKIMHLKSGIVDGRWVFGGSTNWSADGEGKQENHLTIIDSPAEARRLVAQLDAIHAHMLAAA